MKRQGLLFSLGNKTLASTYNQLLQRSRALASDARAFAYWTQGQKGGRFTNLAALSCKVFIQNTIEGKHPEVTESSYFNLPTARYSKWKGSQGFSESQWMRTGKTRDAFIVRTGKVGKKSMGWVSVDPKALTPQIGFSGKQTGFVKVKDIVKWLEFGTVNMDAKPLVSSAIQRFVTLNFPGMVDSLRDSFYDWLKSNNAQSGGGSRESSGSLSDVTSSYTLKSNDSDVISSNPKADFSENKIKEVLSGGGFSTKEMDLKSSNKKENQMMYKALKGSGLSQEEIDRIMKGMEEL